MKIIFVTFGSKQEIDCHYFTLMTDYHSYSFYEGHKNSALPLVEASLSIFKDKDDKLGAKLFENETGLFTYFDDIATFIVDKI